MPIYTAPIEDMMFLFDKLRNNQKYNEIEKYKEVNSELVKSILDEAAKIITTTYFLLSLKNFASINPILASKLRTTGNWKLIPNAKINFITKERYSLTLASNCIGKFVDIPVLSNDKKNLIARGIIK